MPLPETYPRGVFFIGRRDYGSALQRIAGTGFLASVETPATRHAYVVTAAHVVEGAEWTIVRTPMADGSTGDLEVPDWVFHGEHDVAVAPIKLPSGTSAVATPLTQFIDDDGKIADPRWGPVELGDVVYFIGLLGKIRAMVERNIPVVRAGILSALWQDEVPVQRSPLDRAHHITAHLIDCRSFGGFSGSPCYLQKSRAAVSQSAAGVGINTEYRTLLLGLIGGHFDDWGAARTRGADDDRYAVSDNIEAPVSTGIGYVIPAEFIRETLMRDELANLRDEADGDAAGQGRAG